MAVRIKTAEEIVRMREGGKRLAGILHEIIVRAVPGVSSGTLDAHAERLIVSCGGRPVFKGYKISEVKKPFPSSICVSVNDEVVHGIPRADRILKAGDIASIDIGMRWKGLVTDMAVTVGIGKISPDAERLIHATREALDIGIARVRPGTRIGDIGHVIESHLKKNHFGIIRDLAGHGVGHELHEEPLIPNYGKSGTGIRLEEGMVIAIEPMATLGGWRITLDDDEWTFRTRDASVAAHFEHTVAVISEGREILTAL